MTIQVHHITFTYLIAQTLKKRVKHILVATVLSSCIRSSTSCRLRHPRRSGYVGACCKNSTRSPRSVRFQKLSIIIMCMHVHMYGFHNLYSKITSFFLGPGPLIVAHTRPKPEAFNVFSPILGQTHTKIMYAQRGKRHLVDARL